LNDLQIPSGIKVKRTGHMRNGYAWDVIWPGTKIIAVATALEG